MPVLKGVTIGDGGTPSISWNCSGSSRRKWEGSSIGSNAQRRRLRRITSLKPLYPCMRDHCLFHEKFFACCTADIPWRVKPLAFAAQS